MQPNNRSYVIQLNETKQNEIKMYSEIWIIGLHPKNRSCTVALCFCLTAIKFLLEVNLITVL